jgi:hypothetical protein
MNAMLRGAGLGVALLASSFHAWSDPLTELLAAADGTACYDRVYDAAHLARHPRQRTRAIRLGLTDYPETGGATVRIAISEAAVGHYMLGECYWADDANLDIMDEPLLASFGRGPGLNCHATTTIDGSSAEEGGDFPVDLRDGKSVVLHLPESVAGWESFDIGRPPAFFELGADDRVFRLDRAEAALCAELSEKLPWQ